MAVFTIGSSSSAPILGRLGERRFLEPSNLAATTDARDERTLLLGLALAQRLPGAELPAWARSRIECCFAFGRMMDDVVERLETLAEPGALEIARFHMARKEGIFGKCASAR